MPTSATSASQSTSPRSEPHRRAGLRRHDRLHLARADRGRAIDARADVYSLGLRALRVPHGRGAVHARERARGRVRPHERAAAARERGPAGLPAGFDAVVARALAKAPDDRYASAASSPPRASGASGRAPAPQPAAPPPRPRGAGGRGGRGRRRRWAASSSRDGGGEPPGAAARDPPEDARADRRALPRGRRRHPLLEPALGCRVRRGGGLGAPRR